LAPVSVDDLRTPIATSQTDGSVRPRQTDRSGDELSRVARAMSERSQVAATGVAPVIRPSVLVGEREHRLYVLATEKIDYVEAHGNYVKLHAGNAEYISRDSVKRLKTALRHSGFLRIERSLLINVRAILYAQRLGRGTYAFTLTSGQRLCSGATYRGAILQALPLTQAPRPRPAQHDQDWERP
jgi:two-component system, LytTR family, response regulator